MVTILFNYYYFSFKMSKLLINSQNIVPRIIQSEFIMFGRKLKVGCLTHWETIIIKEYSVKYQTDLDIH